MQFLENWNIPSDAKWHSKCYDWVSTEGTKICGNYRDNGSVDRTSPFQSTPPVFLIRPDTNYKVLCVYLITKVKNSFYINLSIKYLSDFYRKLLKNIFCKRFIAFKFFEANKAKIFCFFPLFLKPASINSTWFRNSPLRATFLWH